MKTRDQRRKRRPLGSVLGGPSPTKPEPSGFCLTLVAQYGCLMGEKALSDGQQVDMPSMAKNMAKNCQNMPQIGRKSSKRHHFWQMGLVL